MNGPRYMFMLNNGFKKSDDGIQMKINDSYVRNCPKPSERPKKENIMYKHELV